MKAVERINFAVVAVTAALFLSIAVFVAISTSRMMVSEARSTVENVVKAAVGRIDRQMASVESAVENSAWIVGERLADPDYMFRITGELVQNNPLVVLWFFVFAVQGAPPLELGSSLTSTCRRHHQWQQ